MLSLELVEQINKIIETRTEPVGLLGAVVDVILERTESECGFGVLKQGSGQTPDIVVERLRRSDKKYEIDNSILEVVFRDGKGVIAGGDMIGSVVCVPIKIRERVFGVIYAGASAPNHYDQSHLQVLGHIGFEIGLALENMRLNQAVKKRESQILAGQTALNLSHGIKNVLQAMGSAAEVVDYGLENDMVDRAKQGWKILKRNLNRIRKLVLDMLEFSKDSEPVFDKCHFNKLVESVIETLQGDVEQKGVSIILKTDKKIGVIQLDAEKMHDVVLNLVLNAIDAVPEKTGVVKIETKYFNSNEDEVVLAVSDNGAGIKEEDREKVFEPFETSKSKIGIGLGLAITRKIITQHGGKIEVASSADGGAVFTVTVPCKKFK